MNLYSMITGVHSPSSSSVLTMPQSVDVLLGLVSLRLLLLIGMAYSVTDKSDLLALRDLKSSVDPASIPHGSCLASWNFSLDPCDSRSTDHFTCGFRCDPAATSPSRVTEISLDSAGYSGSLTSVNWTELSSLQLVDLSYNSFTGPVPDSFSNLPNLRGLRLSRNSFSGLIPASLSSLGSLQELRLDNNRLSRNIPPSFRELTALSRLQLEQNNLSGDLPDLSSLENLQFLDVSGNQFSGTIPARLPPNLLALSLRDNRLTGTIPDAIGDLQYLQVLDLSNNEIAGAVPLFLLGHPSLEQLNLSLNNFTALNEPESTGRKESRLVAVDLGGNHIQGFLPSSITSMPRLVSVSLENNRFTGTIPAEYAARAVATPGNGTASFRKLLLGGNYLFGPIPSPLIGLRPGSVNISLVDNCLNKCPDYLFFCKGRNQKPLVACKNFGGIFP